MGSSPTDSKLRHTVAADENTRGQHGDRQRLDADEMGGLRGRLKW
jgi:hypothetical protein